MIEKSSVRSGVAARSRFAFEFRLSEKMDELRYVTVRDSVVQAAGAICTDDGRKLSNRLELTVDGPG